MVTKHTPAIFRNVPAVIQNGIFSRMLSLCSTETVHSGRWGGQFVNIDGQWDLIIAHPPCTFLTVTANSWYDVEKYGDKARQRYQERYSAIVFFMHFVLANCEKIAVENPVGIMNSAYREPDCIIHPYYFGDDAKKKTCLWLKGLPPLVTTYRKIVEPTTVITGNSTDSPWHANTWGLPLEERRRVRSKTFPGIAKAMAEQWGDSIAVTKERIGNDNERTDDEPHG